MSLFKVIYTEIWGPSQIKSILGHSYFVIFIDGLSCIIWLFLVKDRSDVFSMFKLFHNEIMNQFGCSIKIVRSDNVLEYMQSIFVRSDILMQSVFEEYCDSYGIIYQATCAHTPQ